MTLVRSNPTPVSTLSRGADAVLRPTLRLGLLIMAGFFATFSVVVMPGLDLLPPATATAAMQAINAAVRTPLFALAFFGTAALSALAILCLRRDTAAALAGAIYLLGVLLVTMAVNVPLNQSLAASPPLDWAAYTGEWTLWNHLRTVACLAGAVLINRERTRGPTA